MQSFTVAEGRKKIILRHKFSSETLRGILDALITNINIVGERVDSANVTISGEYDVLVATALSDEDRIKYQVTREKHQFLENLVLEKIEAPSDFYQQGIEFQELSEVVTSATANCRPVPISESSEEENNTSFEVEVELNVVAQVMAEPKSVEQWESKPIREMEKCLDKDFLERIKGISLLDPGITGSYIVLYQEGKNYVFGMSRQEHRNARS